MVALPRLVRMLRRPRRIERPQIAEVELLYILMNASGTTMCCMVDIKRIRHRCTVPILSFFLFYLCVIMNSYKG